MEKDNTVIDHERIERLRIAAHFDANSNYPMLFQLLGYRKLLAEQLLRQGIPADIQFELEESLNYTNSKIKKLLGLEE